MNLKENINKIHYLLTENFSDVKLQELSDKYDGKYFLIEASCEGKVLKMKVNFIDLECSKFKWFYSENPLNESSDYIERFSNISTLLEDLRDIFNKNRFSEDYLMKIKK